MSDYATELELVLVEAISQYRMRYFIEVPLGNKDRALDAVTMEEAFEFSQKHLGETIISHRVVSSEEALTIIDEDNEFGADWSDDHKIDTFVTKFDMTPPWANDE